MPYILSHEVKVNKIAKQIYRNCHGKFNETHIIAVKGQRPELLPEYAPKSYVFIGNWG